MRITGLRTLFVLATTLVVALVALSPAIASGTQQAGNDPVASTKLSVVATTSIVGDVVTNVVGDRASVHVLMVAGQNPHSYEPTASALRTLEQADAVFTNGFGLEESLLNTIGALDAPVATVSAGIAPRTPDGESHADPHVWTDPTNVLTWIGNIVTVLSQLDPANAEAYRANGDAYAAKVREIDASIRERIATIPPERRVLVLDHDAFGYFADHYGFTIVGVIVPGLSDVAEPSSRDIANLVSIVREQKVRAIFVGETSGPAIERLAKTVAAESGQSITIVPTLTGALAPAGQPGDTYLGYLRYNADQILGNV